jgi:putative glycosyltransferase
VNISIVTTMFNNAESLQEFLFRARKAVSSEGLDLSEIVIVDDGSDIENFLMAQELCVGVEDIVLIRLTRNFGHHKAILHGLKSATGDLVFLLDSDLEEDPEWLHRFYFELEKSNSDVVYGVQKTRRGNVFERVSGNLFYWMMRRLMGVPIPKDFLTIRLMRKVYVRNLLSHQEYNINLSGLLLITGHKQIAVECVKLRLRPSSYTLKKKFNILLDAVTSFSEVPLRAIFVVGLISFLLSIVEAIILVISLIFFLHPVQGWLSTFLIIQLFGGLTMVSIGVIGIYVSRIFLEVKMRPRVLELSNTSVRYQND